MQFFKKKGRTFFLFLKRGKHLWILCKYPQKYIRILWQMSRGKRDFLRHINALWILRGLHHFLLLGNAAYFRARKVLLFFLHNSWSPWKSRVVAEPMLLLHIWSIWKAVDDAFGASHGSDKWASHAIKERFSIPPSGTKVFFTYRGAVAIFTRG